MRSFCLCLVLLAGLALAEPQQNRAEGAVSAGQPQTVSLDGKYFHGELRLEALDDLRENRQFRFSLKMTNRSQKKVCWSVHVVLLDAQGRLVGASGYNEGTAVEPGREVTFSDDMGMPRLDLQRVRKFKLVLYEDPQPIGIR